MRTRLTVIASLALVLGLAAMPAQAAPIIDFGTGGAGAGGTINYAGGANPLVGTNIRIGVVSCLNGGGDPDCQGQAHTVGSNVAGQNWGRLDFTTGAFQSYDSTSGTYTFGGGGAFQIHGNVAAAGINDPGIGRLLLDGIISTITVDQNGDLFLTVAFGSDAKDLDLLNFFGLDPTLPWQFLGFSISAISPGGGHGGGGSFSSTAFSTDISNQQLPEPASLLLLGSGLTVLGTAIRRRNSAKKNDAAAKS